MVFQDPYSSLNPRLSAEQIVTEPMENFQHLDAATRRDRAVALLERVGLRGDVLTRMPFEFSGGQRQRLGIARALSLRPALIIADEPVSALDVSVQAQVLNLMADLQEEFGLAYLFISHDLGVVEHIGASHRRDVSGPDRRDWRQRDALFASPQHPVYRGADRRRAVARSARAQDAADHRGRGAEPDEPAVRLRVPSALPLCGCALPGGDAGAKVDGGRQAGGLPSALTSGVRCSDPKPRTGNHVSTIKRPHPARSR